MARCEIYYCLDIKLEYLKVSRKMNSMLDIVMYCQDKLVLLKDFYLQLTFSPIKIKNDENEK